MTYRGSEIHLVARPSGEPTPNDFEVIETATDLPGEAQVVVRNDWMSVDPYMRGRMNDLKSYVPPFALGKAMDGLAVGTVVESRSSKLPVGAVVRHGLGWRSYAVLDEASAEVIDTTRVDSTAYLGVLGITGFTAHIGLNVIAPVKPGDTVFISGAAGGVGLVAGVLAKKLGAGRVIGSAGGPEKTSRLVGEFGYDAAIDYKAGDLPGQLGDAAPEGVDVYLDNVGGEHLQAAITAMRPFGRIALCGAISQYNSSTPQPGPDNLLQAVGKRLTLRGYIVSDHNDLREDYVARATEWLVDGSMSSTFTTVDGLENAVGALLSLAHGGNVGKMLVRVSDRS